MRKELCNYLICCGLALKLIACSSVLSTGTTFQHSQNNDVPEDMSLISKDTILIKCNLLSVRISTYENLIFPLKDINPTLIISKNGRFSGFAVCNNFYGKYTKKGNIIKFENIIGTQKNCIKDNYIESIIARTLGEINNYSIEDKKLLLKKDTDLLMIYQIN